MAYSIDPEGLSSVRAALTDDPVVLREVAKEIAAATFVARFFPEAEAPELYQALMRFSVIHAGAMRAVADAAAAICGDLDGVVRSVTETESAVGSAFASVMGEAPLGLVSCATATSQLAAGVCRG